MAKVRYPLPKVHQLLECGPVLLVSTARGEQTNVMPLSWHTMLDFDPPQVGIVMSAQNYSFELLRDTGECVLNIPTKELGRKVVACGRVSGAKVDKFKRFGLTPAPGREVKAPWVAECYANLECRVVDTLPQYELFVLQVVGAWVERGVKNPKTLHHVGGNRFFVAGPRIELKPK